MKRIKKLSMLSILLIISLMQVGCVRISVEGTVNKDKTIDLTYLIAIKNDAEEPSSDLAELKSEFKNAGYEIKPYEKNEYTGLLLSKTFDLDEPCLNTPSLISPLTVIKEEENIYIIKLEPEKIITNNKLKETFDDNHSGTTKNAIEDEGGFVEIVINLPYEAIKDNADFKRNNCTTYGWNVYAIDQKIPEVTFDITKSGKAKPIWKKVLMIVGTILFMVVITLLNYMGYIDKKKEEERC